MIFFKKYILYFWILPLYFLLHNYNELFSFISLKELLILALILYLFSITVYILFWLPFRDSYFSAIASFVIVGYNLFFGAFHDFLKSITHSPFITSYKFVVSASIIFLIFLLVLLRKRKTILIRSTQYLNTLSLVLLLVEFFFFIGNSKTYYQTKNLIYSQFRFSNNFVDVSDSSKPDIYFLVYDEYTNNKALKKLWNYDNNKITDWLEKKGFFVPQNGKANYNFTPFSISSALNMDYLGPHKWKYGKNHFYMLQAVKSFTHNETVSILSKEDYLFRFFIPFENDIEDIGITKEFGDLASKQLYNPFFLNRLQRDIFYNFPENRLTGAITRLFSNKDYNNIHKRLADINTTIQKVKSAAASRTENPKFVYAHFMITHEPHLFDSSGQILQNTNMDSIDFFKSYPNQVKYANKTITELVEFIKMNNKRKAVIIIMGDHGFRKLPPSMIDYNFPNFCAIYFPDRNYSMLYDTISPVNIFKVMFNTCFHQNFPLSKDTSIAVNYQ